MAKYRNDVGLFGILGHYRLKDFISDTLVPMIVTGIFYFVLHYVQLDCFRVLKSCCSLCITALSCLVAVVLASYAILTTFFMNPHMEKILLTENGEKYVNRLSSNYAIALIAPLITIIAAFAVSCTVEMGLPAVRCLADHVMEINGAAFLSMVFLFVFSIWSLYGVIVSLYDMKSVYVAAVKSTETNIEEKTDANVDNA